jgi:O-antigen/teichoic acid export membrane protein
MTPSPKQWIGYLRDRGWMGEAGISLILGAIAAAYLHLSGVDTAVWGVPLSMLYGGGAAAGLFLLTASLRLIPGGND